MLALKEVPILITPHMRLEPVGDEIRCPAMASIATGAGSIRSTWPLRCFLARSHTSEHFAKRSWDSFLGIYWPIDDVPSLPAKSIRARVGYRYDAINPDFLKMLAEIGSYADEKYKDFAQYTQARLTGDRSPINHIYEHLRQYQTGEPYDHFEGDPRRHLAAIAYNAMMEFYYHTRWGHVMTRLEAVSPTKKEEEPTP